MKKTKILSALLAALLALTSAGSLASCRKAGAEPKKEKRTNVYAGETVSLPAEVNYVQSIVTDGAKAYLTYEAEYTAVYNDVGEVVERTPGFKWDENQKREETLPEGWWIGYDSQSMLMTVDLATRETSSAPFAFDGETYGWANGWAPGPDGTLVTRTQKWDYDEETEMSSQKSFIITVDPATAEVKKVIEIVDALGKAGLDPENTYINQFVMTPDGIYLSTETDILVLDTEGGYKSKVPLNLGDGWTQGMWKVGDRLVVAVYSGGKQSLKSVENGQVTDIATETVKSIGSQSPSFSDDSNLYYNTSTGISAYNLENDTYTEVLNFINSDIDESGNLAFLPDGRLLMAVTDWSQSPSATTLSILSRVPDEELAEEIILRLGCVYVDYNLRKSIIRYNKQNTGIRVTMVDYSSYNNEDNEWTGAVTQFNNDITTGKIPDMVLLNSEMPIESYLRKNIFVDLNKYIDDEEKGVNRADFIDKVWRSSETNGRLNSMILTYRIQTLLAKSEIVGTESGWTFDEMMAAIRSLPEGARAFYEYSRDEIVNNFFTYSMESFINWETGETYFDTPGFIEFMEYLKTCPEKGYWEERYGEGYEYDPVADRAFEEEYALRFKNNKALFQMGYFYDFSGYLNSRNEFGLKEVTCIGYPRNGEGNGMVILPTIELAIATKSQAKDQAWEVLKYLMKDEKLTDGFGLTVNRAVMDDMYAKAQENYGDYAPTDDAFDWMVDEGYSEEYIELQKSRRQPYDQAGVDYLRDLILDASTVSRTDSALVDIIKEELSAVLAGAKAADVAAKQIASRVGIYVSEHS